jgi:hypothetical protein
MVARRRFFEKAVRVFEERSVGLLVWFAGEVAGRANGIYPGVAKVETKAW